MKARVIMLAATVVLGAAFAQDPQTPPTTPQQTTPQATPQKSTDTKPAGDMPTASSSQISKPAEMDTKTYRGVLVDMSCASRASLNNAPADSAKSGDDSNSANRAAADPGGNCRVSADSKELGMKMQDGRTVRFDLVGNQRAQEALKNDKGWGKNLGAGKPINAKVLGVLNGDKLIVSSIQ